MKKAILQIIRRPSANGCTIGELLLNGKHFCYTLEDVVRGPKDKKVYGETAIPAGTYQVIVNMSNRFKRLMPLLLDVPGFEGVRLHAGNTAKHTLGCPLLGYCVMPNGMKVYSNVYQGAFLDLMAKLVDCPDITITIK